MELSKDIFCPRFSSTVLGSEMENANSELNGVIWNSCSQRTFYDFDYADGVCLLAHTYADMRRFSVAALVAASVEHKTTLVSLKD